VGAGSADRPDLIGVRVFCPAIIPTALYSIAVSKLRRPFLSDRYFFIAVRLLRRREKRSTTFTLTRRGQVWSAARKIGPALRDQATTNTLA
jgi:hypothetical protein